MNREFLQLAQVFEDKVHIGGWFVSEKLDGMRAWWDGGVTRGIPCSQVPWANTAKDGRLKVAPIATGLWSRYGKVIHAPDWWLDSLPPMSLDGELWTGRSQYQILRDIAGHHSGDEGWSQILFMVFDCPSPEVVLADGRINNPNFSRTLKDCPLYWNRFRGDKEIYSCHPCSSFESRYGGMVQRIHPDKYKAIVLPQDRLSLNLDEAKSQLAQALANILEKKGEGLIIRDPSALYEPKRIRGIQKVKPVLDSEATVTGYVWGRSTDKGSKLLGLMGALIVEWKNITFELSGFTDLERELVKNHPNATPHEHIDRAGKQVTADYTSKHFPIGSVVTFKYRELTDEGIPKEARYFRKREQE